MRIRKLWDPMKALLRLVDGINEWTGRVFAWAVVLIVGITVYDVFMRNVFSLPTVWAFDVSNQLYGLQFMIMAGFGLLHRVHVSVDVFWQHLSPRGQALMDLLSYAVFFFPFMFMLLSQSWQFAARSWATKETGWGAVAMPLYPLKIAIVVATVLLLLQGIATTLRLLGSLTRPKVQA